MHIKALNEHGAMICAIILQPFVTAVQEARCEAAEAVLREIVGTKNTRIGAAPTIESQQAMLKVIMECMRAGRPIPFMVPWGSEKPDFTRSIDIAEVGAIKQMVCLNARIQRFYEPGATFHLRLEDASAEHAFRRLGGFACNATERYSSDLELLLETFDANRLHSIAESKFFPAQRFTEMADGYTERFIRHFRLVDEGRITDNDPDLVNIGWMGVVNNEMRQYYLARFARLYPQFSAAEHLQMVAEYFAGALTRKQLMPMNDILGRHLVLSFVEPIPGAPKGMTETRTYMRTLPQNITSNHMPAWRAKGCVQIGPNGASMKLASWHEQRTYVRNQILVRSPRGFILPVDADLIG